MQKKIAAPLRTHQKASDADYTIQSVARGCTILKCFGRDGSALSLSEVALRSNLSKPTAYRMLVTLVECGMLERREKNSYKLAMSQWHPKKFRLGYASQSEEFSFS